MVLLNKCYGKIDLKLNKFGVSALFTEIFNLFFIKTFFRPDNKIYSVYSAYDSYIVRIIKSLFNEEFIEINL